MKNYDPDKLPQYIFSLKKITEEQQKVIDKQQEIIQQLMQGWLDHNKDIEDLKISVNAYFLWSMILTVVFALTWASMVF